MPRFGFLGRVGNAVYYRGEVKKLKTNSAMPPSMEAVPQPRGAGICGLHHHLQTHRISPP